MNKTTGTGAITPRFEVADLPGTVRTCAPTDCVACQEPCLTTVGSHGDAAWHRAVLKLLGADACRMGGAPDPEPGAGRRFPILVTVCGRCLSRALPGAPEPVALVDGVGRVPVATQP